MDHTGHMAHGDLGHGGMDMPSGPMCSMSVSQKEPTWFVKLRVAADAVYMGHYKPLHHLPLVAHTLDLLSPAFSRRRRPSHCWIRRSARNE